MNFVPQKYTVKSCMEICESAAGSTKVKLVAISLRDCDKIKATSHLDVYSGGAFLDSTEKFCCCCYLNVLLVISYISTTGKESILNSP